VGDRSQDRAQASKTPPDVHPPEFRSVNIFTVEEVWQQWKEGLGGNPPVEELERDWGTRWRSEARMRQWFSRRKVIWDRLQEIIKAGHTAGDAVRQLEKLRKNNPKGTSLNQLVKLLQRQKAQA
jgi:Transcriptional activator of glycolytic enzymes